MTPLLAETAIPKLIGLRADGTPIWRHAGADGWNNFAEPDEGGDEAEETDEGEEADEEEAPEYAPPSEDEWRKTQDAIKRNNGENKRLRLLRKAAAAKGIDLSTDEGVQALQDMLAGNTGKTTTTSDRGAVERAVEKATAKTESKYLPVVAGLAAKAALLDAGFTGTRERIMKLIDLDDIDVVDGEVTGIAEQIAEIKTEFPEWFRGQQKPGGERRRGAADVDGGDRRTKQTASTGAWFEKVDRQMTGG